MDSLQVTEDASAAVATAPRITKEFIEGQLRNIFYVAGDVMLTGGYEADSRGILIPVRFDQLEGYAHHTVCILTTKAGFTVIGHSAPASPENFNAELGQQLAYENAFRQLWPLFAFALLEAKNIGVPAEGYLARAPF